MASPQGGGGNKKQRVEFKKITPTQLEFVQEDAFHNSLGEGGYGIVKKAVWRCREKKMYVAVKQYFMNRAEAKGGFGEELKGLTILQTHKHVVQLLGAYSSHSCSYIVMEYAPLSLEKVLHSKQEVDGKQRYRFDYKSDHVMNWSYQMAVGLAYIHSKNILHRDIKPSNLLLFNDGKLLKLCDFGTARKELSAVGLMTSGVGTARYMAPEVIKGNMYNKACDVFSFGIAVWEMIARQRPIIGKADVDLAIIYAVATGKRPPKIRGLPTAISDMIELCWEEPHMRPSMDEIKCKLHYLCQFVDLELPILETTLNPSMLRHSSVYYSHGDDPEQLVANEDPTTESISIAD